MTSLLVGCSFCVGADAVAALGAVCGAARAELLNARCCFCFGVGATFEATGATEWAELLGAHCFFCTGAGAVTALSAVGGDTGTELLAALGGEAGTDLLEAQEELSHFALLLFLFMPSLILLFDRRRILLPGGADGGTSF